MMPQSCWLTLIVLGGSTALAAAADVAAGQATQLARIAGRGSLRRAYDRRDRTQAALRPWQRGLLEAIGLQGAQYPSAPVSALASGRLEAGAFCMHLELVHFVTGLDRLNLLLLNGAARVTDGERESLRAVVAKHLQEWDLELRTLADGTWNAHTSRELEVVTTCPEAAAVVELESALPRGKDSGSVRRLMTELQMLLHDHPVNEQRSRRGLPVINAIWPWGSGTSGAAAPAQLPSAFGDVPYLRGLYVSSPQSIHPAPRDCAALLQSVESTARAVAVIAVEDQAMLEQGWVAPLTGALAAGRLSRFDLVLDDWHVGVDRSALRKFWRKALPPSQWAA